MDDSKDDETWLLNGSSMRRYDADVESNDAVEDEEPSGNNLTTTFGVFIPCLLSIFGVILFERIGFCVGQAGALAAQLMLTIGFIAVVLTSLSISAVATNGKVRGGGAYFLISRVLGPEFGGTTGIILYASNIAACCMYILGFVEALLGAFGKDHGNLTHTFAEDYWSQYMYASVLMFLCFIVVVAGAKYFAASSSVIFLILVVSIISVFGSLFFGGGGEVATKFGYTHPQLATFESNLLSNFTASPVHGMEASGEENSYFTVFAIMFPACTGVMAGANMSGDLKEPSKSIPRGTLAALGVSYVVYTILIFSIAASIERYSLQYYFLVLQFISFWQPLVIVGIFAATVSSALGSLIGASRILQAVAKDQLVGGNLLRPFGVGYGKNDEPIFAVIVSYFLVQLMLFIGSLNAVAPFVTVFFLASYCITNLACLGPALTSAPNWRPSFRYFRWQSAALGALMCFAGMFFVNWAVALVTVVLLVILFIVIHYTAPQTEWGDLSQALIYHQVRKYLLILDTRKEHVKYWRPQVLLCVSSLQRDYCLITFANNLKKSGLFILGHVLLGGVDERLDELAEVNRSWLKFIDLASIKAFADFSVARTVREGLCSLFLACGLGGMRPNIVIMGFARDVNDVDPDQSWNELPPNKNRAKLDAMFAEAPVLRNRPNAFESNAEFVGSLHDALLLEKSLAIARGFSRLALTHFENRSPIRRTKMFIDVYAIPVDGTTNAQTITMTLQLANVLSRVPKWKRSCVVRVLAPVVPPANIADTSAQLEDLLDLLRIDAKMEVLPLCSKADLPGAFDGLSPIEQATLFNNFMRKHSQPATTAVVFTTLPPPPPVSMTNSPQDQPPHFASRSLRSGLAHDALQLARRVWSLGSINVSNCDAEQFYQVIDKFSSGLPPCLMVHGTAVTVTSQL